ncbi:hypothetical protein CIP107534_01447 [Corynebacterium diphtheriae]|nr:hypothetical protein CIP107523_01386 [Corynebacterium diphtheriae]CAB0558804.1 hypothetical protein CIP107529_01508 [Corynebacterium diphtheriae]CAB0560734.1 hypothetical protein CIP107521_01602 [Corynebacterium diphtheriae]CAB0567518.1 hypothetical protein CIP107534_01447 [Corynebacterium diphtheriae]CAB0605070.1 hypothetical protein CIP107549_01448 [Corynebacterium diphtheriae]
MRLTAFYQKLEEEFGQMKGAWIVHSHVLSRTGKTIEDSIEHEIDLRQVWFDLCDDFKIPEQRR